MLRGVPNVKLHHISISLPGIKEISIVCVPHAAPSRIGKIIPRFHILIIIHKIHYMNAFICNYIKKHFHVRSSLNRATCTMCTWRIHSLKEYLKVWSYVCTTVLLITLVILAVLSNPQLSKIPSSTNGWKQQSRIGLLWIVRNWEVLKSIALICKLKNSKL